MIHGELIVDNFAGGGGASTRIELATGYSVDIAINHDQKQLRCIRRTIRTRSIENVWAVDTVKACNGHPVALGWFSPDCKHFSKAKGIENKIIGEIVHVKEKRIIKKEKSVNGVMG